MQSTNKTNIIILITNKFLGDDNSSLGVAKALKEKLLQNQQQITITQYKQNDWLNINIDELQNTIIVGAGEATLQTLTDLRIKHKNKIFISWSSHQLPEKVIQDSLYSFDIINLPQGIITTFVEKEKFKGKLLETNGVPHNLSKADLKDAYEKAKKFLPELNENKKQILFVLGGDAPNASTGKVQFFTQQDVEQLVTYIKQFEENKYQIFIVNGPRTGKYIFKMNEENISPYTHSDSIEKYNKSAKLIENPIAHRIDKEITEPSDPVSIHLVKLLNDSKIDYSFYDFRYGGEFSFFNALLYCCNIAFIPGESTSMISEAKDFTGIVIYTNSAMNKSHERFVNQVSTKYGLKVLNGQILEKNVECKPFSTLTAAETVANAIVNTLEISPLTPSF